MEKFINVLRSEKNKAGNYNTLCYIDVASEEEGITVLGKKWFFMENPEEITVEKFKFNPSKWEFETNSEGFTWGRLKV